MRFFIGLIITFAGVMLVIKSEWLLNNFGRMNFFEKYLGSEGGSRLGYKLIGMLIIFLGILITTNLIFGFMAWIMSPLLRYTMP